MPHVVDDRITSVSDGISEFAQTHTLGRQIVQRAVL